METVIQRVQERARRIASGQDERVAPGQPVRFTEGCVAGDAIAQGDLYLVLMDEVPKDRCVRVEEPSKQLVPGNTEGARHCLDSLDGVEVFRVVDPSIQDGPVLRLWKERVVLHPVHGNVTLLADTVVHCVYQREWAKEQAVRARD